MSEIITLSAPLDPARIVFRISMMAFDWFNATIKIHLREWDGALFGSSPFVVMYTGPVATTLMTALNKTNLSTQSLHQRVMARLLADGKLPTGFASGSAD